MRWGIYSNNNAHVSDGLVMMEEIEREWGTIHVGVWCVFLMWDVVKMVEEIDVVHVIYLATEVEFV